MRADFLDDSCQLQFQEAAEKGLPDFFCRFRFTLSRFQAFFFGFHFFASASR